MVIKRLMVKGNTLRVMVIKRLMGKGNTLRVMVIKRLKVKGNTQQGHGHQETRGKGKHSIGSWSSRDSW
jgi:hypothetical protein